MAISKRRGRWVLDYRDASGVRKWVTVDGNRKDAETEMAKLTLAGKKSLNRKATVKEQAVVWLEAEAKARTKGSTYHEYKAAFDNHIVPYMGEVKFCRLDRQDVIRFIGHLKDVKKLSRGTVKNTIAPLRAMYYDAITNGTPVANPCVKLGKYLPPKDVTPKPKPLNREEILDLLAVVKEKMPHWYPLFVTMIYTGLRLGELIALIWDELDWHGKFIEVRQALSRDANLCPEISDTKNHKVRHVEMAQPLMDVLRHLHIKRKAEALKNGTEISEFVFLTPAGARLDPSNLRKQVFYKALGMAGLRRVRLHDSRHSFGSLLIEKGEDLNYVKQQLGHHSITLTCDTYGHRLKNDRKAVDGLLDGPKTQQDPEKMVADW
jgi:integrase